MRVCPECGHADHPMWRPSRFRPLCEHTLVDTLEWNAPELLKKIKESSTDFYYDGHFVYHIVKSGIWVERIEKELYDIMKWGAEPQEHTDHSILSMVPKLAEYMTKSDQGGET